MNIWLSRRMLGSLAALGFALVIAAGAGQLVRGGPENATELLGLTRGGYVATSPSQALPVLAFTDGDGRRMDLGAFRGRVVLLNLWATWCAPCVKEMPSLERIQAALGGADFQVVALAEDRGGAKVVLPFLEKLGVRSLPAYLDAEGTATRIMKAQGLPTTILIDRDGREVGRMLGGSEWDQPRSRQLIERLIAEGKPAALING